MFYLLRSGSWPSADRRVTKRCPLAVLLTLTVLSCSEGAPIIEPEAALGVRRLFPTETAPGHLWTDCMYASPLLVQSQGERFVMVAAGEMLTAIDPDSGDARWQVAISAPARQNSWIVATPVVAGSKLVVVFQHTQLMKRDRLSHHAVVVDLETRDLDPEFPELEFVATKPAFDGKRVAFSPRNAVSRAALAYAPLPDRELGLVYVAFGNSQDIQPWHGWVFELDLEAWRREVRFDGPIELPDVPGAAPELQPDAISGVLLTTPESDCGESGASGSREMRCGAGVWSPAGPKIYPSADGAFELLVPTGNGILDLNRGDYAHSLMRLRRGLSFDPHCDMTQCRSFNPRNPPLDCVASCRDLFIPRILPGAPALRPESGACEGLSLFECYAALDYDLGANSPAKLRLPSGRTVIVLPAKDGAVYLMDGDHMGTLYDRQQLAQPCGTRTDRCRTDWAGMMVTEPLILDSESGGKLILLSTFESDRSHPAGIIGLKVEENAERAWLTRLWQAPRFADPLALQLFRQHPSRIAALQLAGHNYAFVVDVAQGAIGHLIGVRAEDGALASHVALRGPGQRFVQPLAFENRIYVPSCTRDSGPSQIEAYEFSPPPP